MKKTLLIVIIIVIIAGTGAFYGGMKYGEGKGGQVFSRGDFQNFRNLSSEEQQQRLQELEANPNATFRGMMGGNRMSPAGVAGEIIAKDEQSLTVKLPDGGSKIIFFSQTTDIIKTVKGSLADLAVGSQITVSGDENSDGSYTAKIIQIRDNEVFNQ